MESSLNFDNIIYLYICENPTLFKIVDVSFFKSVYVQKLYKLTKVYWSNFESIPFDVENPSVDTIKEVAYRYIDQIITDPALDKEENLELFNTNAEHIILHTDYKKWDRKFLKESIESWIELSNLEKGLALTSEHLKTGERTPNNMRQLLGEARDIFNKRANIVIHDEISQSFTDAESHRQIDSKDLINCGYKNLNMWLSGSYSGGFEPGTSTIFIGESNVGKSIWLGNLSYNMFLNGNNILFVSLEMSVAKTYKRIGANAFDIHIDKYGEVAKDLNLMNRKIRDFKKKNGTDIIPLGQLMGVRFTNATVKDIEVFAQKESKRLGIKWHAIVIDYMTELDNSYGTNPENSYLYHKQNSSDLFAMAQDNYWASITAHQLKGDSMGADDLTMHSMAESRGIPHRTDNIIGIIQPPDMRHENRYILKNIKTRDGGYKNYRSGYTIDYNYMRLVEQDEMIQPNDMLIASMG